MAELSEIERLREIVARLRAPDGCPWDREQTHASLRTCLVEEAYEVAEAIDKNDDAHLCEELGDLLLQVVMHSHLASEQRRFDLDKVARGIADKLVRRHPHVFGDVTLDGTDAVLQQWDEIKRAEKGTANGSGGSVLDGISLALPALMRAEKVQKRAARVGFDWPEARDVLEKIREETAEVAAAIESRDPAQIEEEIGDLLFALVNLARKAALDAELTLQSATGKFITRFQQLEKILRERGQEPSGLTLAQLDGVWDEIKAARPPATAV